MSDLTDAELGFVPYEDEEDMKPEYEPKTLEAILGKLVEECGEVQAACGKTLRFGLESTNPELPPEKRETNRAWILRELRDLRWAMLKVEVALGAATAAGEE